MPSLIPGMGSLELKLEESLLIMEKILFELRKTNDLLTLIYAEGGLPNGSGRVSN